MKFVNKDRLEYLWQKAFGTFAKPSDVETAVSTHNESITSHSDIRESISDIEELIPETATSQNQLVDEEAMYNAISQNTSAPVLSNIEFTNPFEIQSETYARMIDPSNPPQSLEAGPWYKLKNGVVYECNHTTGVYVEENDMATVSSDETKFFFYTHGVKYQRIKTGSGLGQINCADGTATNLVLKPSSSSSPYPDTDPTAYFRYPDTQVDRTIFYFIDRSAQIHLIHPNHDVLFLVDISDITIRTGAIQEWLIPLNGGINDITSMEQRQDTYTLTFPSARYFCSRSQSYDAQTGVETPPIWALYTTMGEFELSPSQVEALNSTITRSKVATYTQAVAVLNSHVLNTNIHVSSSQKAWMDEQMAAYLYAKAVDAYSLNQVGASVTYYTDTTPSTDFSLTVEVAPTFIFTEGGTAESVAAKNESVVLQNGWTLSDTNTYTKSLSSAGTITAQAFTFKPSTGDYASITSDISKSSTACTMTVVSPAWYGYIPLANAGSQSDVESYLSSHIGDSQFTRLTSNVTNRDYTLSNSTGSPVVLVIVSKGTSSATAFTASVPFTQYTGCSFTSPRNPQITCSGYKVYVGQNSVGSSPVDYKLTIKLS